MTDGRPEDSEPEIQIPEDTDEIMRRAWRRLTNAAGVTAEEMSGAVLATANAGVSLRHLTDTVRDEVSDRPRDPVTTQAVNTPPAKKARDPTRRRIMLPKRSI